MHEPAATGATLWGFDDSDTPVQVARRLQSVAGWRRRVEAMVCERAIDAMRRRRAGRSGGHLHSRGAGGRRGRVTTRWPKHHSFDGGLKFIPTSHDTDIPVKEGDAGGARA